MHSRFLNIGFLALMAITFSSPAHAEDEAKARKLINSQGCKACHTLNGDGGITASSFEAIRASLSRQEIRQQLVSPAHKRSNSMNPDYSHLSEAEINTLVNFIQPEP